MKRWMWIVFAVIIAVGVGSYSYTRYRLQEESYADEMRTGERALKDHDYSLAETSFTHASRTRASNATAQRYLTQTQTYVDGTQAMNNRKFSAAKQDFTTVKTTKHGATTLIQQAREQLTLLQKIQDKRKTYQQQYQQALTLNKANEFTDSNVVIATLLKDKTFKQRYYQDIRKNVLTLRKQNNASLKTLTGSVPALPNTAQSIAGTSGAQSSPSQNGQTKQNSQANSSSSSTTASVANGASGTTSPSASSSSNQIQATRAELNEQGVDASQYSDAEIQAIIQRAAAQHLSLAQAVKTMNQSSDQIQATRDELSQAGFDASQYTDAQIEAILQQASSQHMSIAQAAKSLQ